MINKINVNIMQSIFHLLELHFANTGAFLVNLLFVSLLFNCNILTDIS